MLSRDQYLSLVNPDNPLVNTAAYARVERAAPGTAWRAVCVYHLPSEQNRGGHAIYVGLLTTQGEWAQTQTDTVQVGWTWEGRRPDEPAPAKPFEKQPPELGAVVDLWMGQKTTIWIEDSLGVPSDKVVGLHSSVEDLPQFNTTGHNSFVVIFRMMTIAPPVIITPPIPDGPSEPQPPTLTIETRLTVVEAEIAELKRWRKTMENNGR